MFHAMNLGYSLTGFVVTLIIAILVYKDAEKRGTGNAVLWAIGTFFCCPIVPIIYVIVRK